MFCSVISSVLKQELKAGFQLQDMQILQNVLSTMNPQVLATLLTTVSTEVRRVL